MINKSLKNEKNPKVDIEKLMLHFWGKQVSLCYAVRSNNDKKTGLKIVLVCLEHHLKLVMCIQKI